MLNESAGLLMILMTRTHIPVILNDSFEPNISAWTRILSISELLDNGITTFLELTIRSPSTVWVMTLMKAPEV